MQTKSKEKKEPQHPRWLKIENKSNEHKQGITILCRNYVDLIQTKERYNSSNYTVTEFNSDPRKNITMQRKKFK